MVSLVTYFDVFRLQYLPERVPMPLFLSLSQREPFKGILSHRNRRLLVRCGWIVYSSMIRALIAGDCGKRTRFFYVLKRPISAKLLQSLFQCNNRYFKELRLLFTVTSLCLNALTKAAGLVSGFGRQLFAAHREASRAAPEAEDRPPT
jgi:hypothetical protein